MATLARWKSQVASFGGVATPDVAQRQNEPVLLHFSVMERKQSLSKEEMSCSWSWQLFCRAAPEGFFQLWPIRFSERGAFISSHLDQATVPIKPLDSKEMLDTREHITYLDLLVTMSHCFYFCKSTISKKKSSPVHLWTASSPACNCCCLHCYQFAIFNSNFSSCSGAEGPTLNSLTHIRSPVTQGGGGGFCVSYQ